MSFLRARKQIYLLRIYKVSGTGSVSFLGHSICVGKIHILKVERLKLNKVKLCDHSQTQSMAELKSELESGWKAQVHPSYQFKGTALNCKTKVYWTSEVISFFPILSTTQTTSLKAVLGKFLNLELEGLPTTSCSFP